MKPTTWKDSVMFVCLNTATLINFYFSVIFVVFSGLHKVSENIQRAAKRRSITLPAVP